MADNLTTPFPTGTVLRTKDTGSGHLPESLLTDSVGIDAIGDVAASPAANTLLGRLKALATALAAQLPATLGTKVGTASLSVVPASDGFAVTTDAGSSRTYVPITPGAGNLAGGACRAIVAEVAGRVNLKQPDGNARSNFPLVAGVNPIGALMIDAPTSGTAATGIWALY